MKSKETGMSEDRKKQIAYCTFGLVVVIYVYLQFFRDPTPTAAPPAVPVIVTAPASSAGAVTTASTPASSPAAGPAAKLAGTNSAALDPTLHMEAMLVTESVVYAGSGRNIFSAVSAPPPIVIPKPIASARPGVLPPAPQPVTQPCPPACPPPPPIPLRFFGTVENPPGSGARTAFLLHGEDTFLAVPGDIVLRRYRVVSVSGTSIVMEDLTNNNQQTLPLVAN